MIVQFIGPNFQQIYQVSSKSVQTTYIKAEKAGKTDRQTDRQIDRHADRNRNRLTAGENNNLEYDPPPTVEEK